ncbi:MAG TPA: hypothetical protein VFV40_07260 [Nocardioides sp.]|nr:hypothetical protein [Nocardioides sp.]
MRGKAAGAAALGLVGAFVVVGPGIAGNDELRNKYESTESTHDCGDDSTITYGGPLKMWPPNHKLQAVSITATDGDAEPATDDTTLTVTFRVLDAVGGDGGPRHDPDVLFTSGPTATGNPEATVPFQLRSERSGRGGERQYELTATAAFDNGLPTGSCTATFVVKVPHDMRGGADWK